MSIEYYFAYGSNLNKSDWKKFCDRNGFSSESIKAIEPVLLPDMCLSFDYYSISRKGGALNIVPAHGHVVHGVLYHVSAEGWQALDYKEDAPFCYERVGRTALRYDGTRIPVFVYEVTAERRTSFCPPSPDYYQIVAEGLRTWKLSTGALDAAASGHTPCSALNALFVYGTLMSGQPNSRLIPPDRIISARRAWAPGTLYDSGSGFPALVISTSGADVVHGECLNVEGLPELLETLDWLEAFQGYDKHSLFYRSILKIKTNQGESLFAWCYVTEQPSLQQQLIEHGCWHSHIA